tara:strand:+ start:760 stop:1710 length:951 start_codon:yes stop_codon:yes gene_type:complete
MINLNSKIFVAGHKGLVGNAILRKLKEKGYKNIIIASRSRLDLTNQNKVKNFLNKIKPDFIFIAAAKVGGIILNNSFKADMIYNNLAIQTNLINLAYKSGVKNLLFLGSSCVYPRNCKQPIKEEYLLTDTLEKTNDAYAIAKIAGIKMCESYNKQYKTNYKCIMPTNTFGPNDKYDKINSHFFPALLKKIHDCKTNKNKTLVLWGNGNARREMIYVDDLADACVYFMKKKFKETIINIGTGKDFKIKEYVKIISNVIAPELKIKTKYDKSKPNGTPRKLLDIKLSKKYGWHAKTKLDRAIYLTYKDFLNKKQVYKG